MAVQAVSAKALPHPSADINLVELTQNEIEPTRMAAMKNAAKVRLKNIVSFAKLFIRSGKS